MNSHRQTNDTVGEVFTIGKSGVHAIDPANVIAWLLEIAEEIAKELFKKRKTRISGIKAHGLHENQVYAANRLESFFNYAWTPESRCNKFFACNPCP